MSNATELFVWWLITVCTYVHNMCECKIIVTKLASLFVLFAFPHSICVCLPRSSRNLIALYIVATGFLMYIFICCPSVSCC